MSGCVVCASVKMALGQPTDSPSRPLIATSASVATLALAQHTSLAEVLDRLCYVHRGDVDDAQRRMAS